MTTKSIENLSMLYDRYDVLLCDIWGVLHNGITVFMQAQQALIEAREAGKCVILLTNSPRTAEDVIVQLTTIGARRECYDGVVTSGDATRVLLAQAPRRLFLIGPNYDVGLFDGLDIELVEEFEAQGVIVTGLYDDENETPADYQEILSRLRARDLPLICANPDLEVERGSKRFWCAGALARDYTQLGGRVQVAGKPHEPIYKLAKEKAGEVVGSSVEKKRILAIGDGILTDVKGGVLNDLDVLYIAGGIGACHYAKNQKIDEEQIATFFQQHHLTPNYMMMGLK